VNLCRPACTELGYGAAGKVFLPNLALWDQARAPLAARGTRAARAKAIATRPGPPASRAPSAWLRHGRKLPALAADDPVLTGGRGEERGVR
jgi:hypothetical protein